jgi:DNA-directed RNA polymerase specialized sigma54-like protein
LRELSEDLRVPLAEVEAALALVQTLEPTGVGARSLSECIALQAKEADRYDPAMARLIDNLELVARGNSSASNACAAWMTRIWPTCCVNCAAMIPSPACVTAAAGASRWCPIF